MKFLFQLYNQYEYIFAVLISVFAWLIGFMSSKLKSYLKKVNATLTKRPKPRLNLSVAKMI